MLHNVTYSKSMNGHPCQLNCFTYNNFLILNNNSRKTYGSPHHPILKV